MIRTVRLERCWELSSPRAADEAGTPTVRRAAPPALRAQRLEAALPSVARQAPRASEPRRESPSLSRAGAEGWRLLSRFRPAAPSPPEPVLVSPCRPT